MSESPHRPSPGLDPARVPAPLGPSRAQRDHVVEQLQSAFGEGAMTVEQLDERLELAESARDLPELHVLTADLPAIVGDPHAPTGLEVPARQVPAVARPDDSTTVVAVFGGSQRTGLWTPPAHVRSVAVFGGVDLDFRQAELAPGSLTHVHCFATFGGVSICVPPTVNLVTQGLGIFGGFAGKNRQVDPAAPTVKVTGLAVFGGVDVRVKAS